MTTTALAALLAGLVLLDAAGAARDPAPDFEVQEVAPGVYTIVVDEVPGLLPPANTVFLVNDADVMVVDPGGSAAEARTRLAALREITTAPVRYVINTHGHDDHTGGNAVFRDAYRHVEIIAHVSVAAGAADDRVRRRTVALQLPATVERLQRALRTGVGLDGAPLTAAARPPIERDAARLAAYARTIERESPGQPTLPVFQRLTLRRGARTIEILSFGAAHSPGDVVVFLPAERVLVAGDLVTWPLPIADADSSLHGWALALAGLRQLDADVIVPGHGPVLRGWGSVERLGELIGDADRATQEAPSGRTPADLLAARLARWRPALAAETPLGGVLFDRFVAGAAEAAGRRTAVPATTSR